MDVRNAPRATLSYNAIGDGMALGIALIAACPCKPARKVIDVSGDNPDMRSNLPAPTARDLAVKAGITVNALAILQDDRLGPGGKPTRPRGFRPGAQAEADPGDSPALNRGAGALDLQAGISLGPSRRHQPPP
jgi:hypothetical protein